MLYYERRPGKAVTSHPTTLRQFLVRRGNDTALNPASTHARFGNTAWGTSHHPIVLARRKPKYFTKCTAHADSIVNVT